MSDREFHATIRHNFLASSSAGFRLLQHSRSLLAWLFFSALGALLLVSQGPVARAVTYNYAGLNHLRQAIHPTNPTITTLNPDLGPDPSGGPIGTTYPSQGFRDAMTSSLAAADWWGDEIVTFNWTGDLNGVFFFDVYRAVAEHNVGRAQLLVRYQRGPGDPAAEDLFWIQTVDTSLRGNNVPNNEVIPYADVYASSYPAGQKLPFYYRPDETVLDNNPYVGQANIRSSSYNIGGNNLTYDIAFWDQPSRPIFNWWRGELFLATYDAANKFVKVYDGFLWGFDVVPEPANIAFVAALMLFAMTRARRRAA